MNWDAISFDWNQVRAFLATAEEGTFSAAARALKTTQPTIGRQISDLEDKLGVTLLERSVKGPTLTEAGEILLQHVRSMSDAAAMISMAAQSQSTDVTGTVRITAFDLMASHLLPALLHPLHQKVPGIRPELVSSNTINDLLLREADIAIRHVRPDQPELIARYLGNMRTHLYASSAYLDREGRPNSLEEVGNLNFVGVPEGAGMVKALSSLGIPIHKENFVITSNSGVAITNCVKEGFGVTLAPAAILDLEPGLERVLPDLPTPQMPLWLATHRELQTSKRIRIVFDHLAHGLEQAIQPK